MSKTTVDKASKRHADLIAAFAHDMKAPMAGNAQLLELMLENEFGPLTAETKEVVSVMLRSNLGMQHVLQILVDIFRYEALGGSLTSERIALAALLDQAAHECDAEVQAYLQMNIDPALSVAGDRDSLLRLFTLLLSYSLKMKSTDARVSVTATGDKGRTTICVEGARLTLGEQIRELEAFKNLCNNDSGRKLPAGAGMALYMCALIVEANHGEIIAERTSPVSTTFSIILPGEP